MVIAVRFCLHRLLCYMNMHLSIVLCCGMQNQQIITICCEFHKTISVQNMTVSVFPFLSYRNMIVLIVGTKACLQTNYGVVVKFIALPS